MPLDLRKEREKAKQFENKSARIPICLCIDGSMSMNTEGRMIAVNNGIKNFINQTKNDRLSRDAVDIGIVSFGRTASVIQPFDNVRNVNFQEISEGGGSPMGEAMELALNETIRHYDALKARGIPCFKPILIIMSDGEADDDSKCRVVSKKILEEVKKRRLQLKLIDLSDESRLSQYFPGIPAITFDVMQIGQFFNDLSRSTQSLSVAMPGTEQQI